MALGSSSFLI